MTGPAHGIEDLPRHVIELYRRYLGVNAVTSLSTARHILLRLSGDAGVGVLKIHIDVDSPDLWVREHTANVLFQGHSHLLDAVPGYLLFKFVDAQPLVRRLIADPQSSP